MPRDFAQKHRQPTPRGGRRRSPRRPARRKQPVIAWRTFAVGVLTGIGVTLTGSYLPELVNAIDAPLAAGAPAESSASTPHVPHFEFYQRLEENAVTADPSVYATPGRTAGAEASADTRYLIQAGSFRNAGDAERLRGRILLLGFEVKTRQVRLKEGSAWHRVLVGPFDDRTELRRAQTRLREEAIDTLPLAVPRTAG